MDIDSACGPTGKAVYDAAQIADPEIDYSDFDTDKDGVVDFFMMVFAGVGGHGESQTSASRPTTTSGRTPRASSLLHRPGDRPEGLHLATTSSRTSRAGCSSTTNAARPTMTTDDDGLPGLRPRRPVQRQPRDGDRQGERDLARVRPLARPAGLLLDGQPRRLRRLEPDGDRQLAAHGRLRRSRSSAGSCRASSSPARRPSPAGQDSRSNTHRSTGRTPDGNAVHPDRRRA